MKKNVYLKLLIIFTMFLSSSNVYATVFKFNTCTDVGAYNIEATDTSTSTAAWLTKDDFVIQSHVSENGTTGINVTITAAGNAKHGLPISVTSTRYAMKCINKSDGSIVTCPPQNYESFVYKQYKTTNTQTTVGTSTGEDKKVLETKLSDNIKLDLNINTGKFTITLTDPTTLKLQDDDTTYDYYIRYVPDSSGLNKNAAKSATDYTAELLSKNSAGKYVINNVDPSPTLNYDGDIGTPQENVHYNIVYFEFYMKSGDCANTLVATIPIFMPTADSVEVENPAYIGRDTADNYGCKKVVDYCAGRDKNGNGTPLRCNSSVDENTEEGQEIAMFNQAKRDYFPECYEPTITYGELKKVKTTIDNKYKEFTERFANFAKTSAAGILTCEDSHTKTRVSVSQKTYYWSLTCFDTYTAKGDTAKLIYAGDGFEYNTEYTVTRTCSISQRRQAFKRPQCHHECVGSCTWTNDDGSTGEGHDAGPTNTFDSCIKQCDNGKYTQECINTCYNKSYEENRNLDFSDKFSYTAPSTNIIQIDEAIGRGETEHGNPGTVYKSDCGEEYVVSDWCSGRDYSCDYHEVITPDGCSDDPEGDYKRDKDDSKEQLANLMAAARNALAAGNYTYDIEDSYLKTSSGNLYHFKIDSGGKSEIKASIGGNVISDRIDNVNNDYHYIGIPNNRVNINDNYTYSDDLNVNVDRDDKVLSQQTATTSHGEDDYDEATYYTNYTQQTIFTTSLPLSYINKVNSDVVYKTNEDSGAYKINHRNSKFESVNNFDVLRFYNKNNERKYYTSILSKSINTVYKEDVKRIYLVQKQLADFNIKVSSSGVAGGFASDIQCYYGLYNNHYCPPPCNDGDRDISGIQYIYRPIDLDDVFPNERNPRYNWTGTLNRTDKTKSGAALYAGDNYMQYDVDPIKLTGEIEGKGDSIYTDSGEYDYEFVLTRENIRNIRNYNENVRDYNGDCISGDNESCHNYLDYNMNCYKDSKGKEICTSYFLDNIDGNSGSNSGSNFITYSVGGFNTESRKRLAGCNNAYNRECVDLITSTTGGKYE